MFDLDVRLAEKDRHPLWEPSPGKRIFLLTGDKKDFGHLFGKTVHGVKSSRSDALCRTCRARNRR